VPPSLSAFAIWRALRIPVALMSSITLRTSVARLCAFPTPRK
jgi:hypothetical protein